MPDNFDNARGIWDQYRSGDEAAMAAHREQNRSQALELIRNAQSFVVIANGDSDPEVVTTSCSVIHAPDEPDIGMALMRFVIRLWFSDTEHDDKAALAIGSVILCDMFADSIMRYIEDGGQL